MLGILKQTKLLKLFYAMKNLYKTKVTTHGGRNGRTRSEDGILDMELKSQKVLEALVEIILIQSNYLLQDIRHVTGVPWR